MTESNKGDRTASGEPISAESDAKARVKGAVAEGESAPDAGTRSGSLTGPAPSVSTDQTEAGEDRSELAASAQPVTEVLAS